MTEDPSRTGAAGDAAPELAGAIVDGTHRLRVRVYFEDTDFSGLVYHASYLRFMERGRSDMLRCLGIGHRALAAGGWGAPLVFAVHDLAVRWRGSAGIDDVLEVATGVARVSPARLVLAQSVARDGAPLLEGRVEVVLLGPDRRPRRVPPALAAAFAPLAPAADPGA